MLGVSGGGGNRTRVLRRLIKTSPGAACCSFLSPSDLAGKSLRAQSLFGFPTASVTEAIGEALYRCQVPERGHIWADSSAAVRQRERAGCYRHLLKSPRVVNEITRHPRPASLESTSEVETVHPLVGLLALSRIPAFVNAELAQASGGTAIPCRSIPCSIALTTVSTTFTRAHLLFSASTSVHGASAWSVRSNISSTAAAYAA